jgi:hypothetical protein
VLRVLDAYVSAVEARDPAAVTRLFDARALVEIPMLRPNRLVGAREIEKGHAATFETLQDIAFDLKPALANATHAIAEGVLKTRRATGEEETLTVGIVAEAGEGGLTRLSLHCDARNLRLWSDRTIL